MIERGYCNTMMVVHFPCKLSVKIKKLSVKIKTWDLSVKYKFLISVCFDCLTFCPIISLLYCMIFKLLHYSFVDPDKCIVMIDSCWFTCNFLSINLGTSYSSFEIKHFPQPWCLFIVFYVNFCLYYYLFLYLSGILATVFGATGFLGRYVVQQLGKLSGNILSCIDWSLSLEKALIFKKLDLCNAF